MIDEKMRIRLINYDFRLSHERTVKLLLLKIRFKGKTALRDSFLK